ncbi:hypothetical protein COC42_12880 [Sphingomonas spermidinifaciens]|uniref:Uncharacterized protein n=1 Tax=Sphingomonas spermidinifaciens TaxID=1141889 RepID=A0A2A4B3L9_9SPHN|nr:hypothetical protein [Sphingomonas spermidinifaciens]PCD02328.1 hypothetical protein COC42_12880 [Sphingomonas spermidinifaciens]
MSLGPSIGRIALLVLSGTATLSLIGAIAETADTGPAPPPAAVTRPSPIGEIVPGEVVRVVAPSEAPVPPAPDRELERWLRAISYALTALAGFAAAGVVVLLRIASALSRIADRD